MDDEIELPEAIVAVAKAIDRLGTGGTYGPGAVEAVAMSLGGEGLRGSVRGGLEEVASALGSIAEAIDRLADVLEAKA